MRLSVPSKFLIITSCREEKSMDFTETQFVCAVTMRTEALNAPAANASFRSCMLFRSLIVNLADVVSDGGAVVREAVQRLAFPELRQLFETCRTPGEARAWIEKAKAKPPADWPIPEILQAIWELQHDNQLREPVKFAAVRMQTPQMKRFMERELQEWMQSVKRSAPQYITLDGDVVYLEVSPERIIQAVRGHVQKLPVEYQPPSVLRELKQAADAQTNAPAGKVVDIKKIMKKN
jgi:hypothetical protein